MRGRGRLLIQGVIDLCFLENGQWVLADYKTDHASGDELLARYSLQLSWYSRALALITGIPVKETLVFSLREGKAYPVDTAAYQGTMPFAGEKGVTILQKND